MSSPWAKIPVPEPSNLKDIMFEESTKENKKCLEEKNLQSDFNQKQFFNLDTDENLYNPDTDAAIAKLLQQQYDEEYNETLGTTKKKQIYASVLFPQFVFQMKASDFSEINSDEEELENINEKGLQHSDEVISKYDVKLFEAKNMPGTSNLKSLPSVCSEYIDDFAVTDFKLPNKVCNR